MSDKDNQFTEEELLDMTEEERNAVNAELTEAEGANPEQDDDDGPDAVIPDDAGDTPAATPADPAVPSTDDPAQDAANKPFVAQYAVKDDAEFTTRIEAVNQQINDLTEQLDSGDIDFSEYNRQKDALMDARYEVKSEQLRNQMAADHNTQSADQLWKYEQSLFLKEHGEYKANVTLMGALQAAIHHVDANGESTGLSGLDVLAKAHQMVEEAMGSRSATKTNDKQAKEDAIPKDPRTARSKANLPKTLGGLPAADENDAQQGEFAGLDKLSGPAFEKALESLSDAQQERYLKG